MTWRIIGFVLAAGLLIGFRLQARNGRRTQLSATALAESWSLSSLLLASSLTLFAELALIRWLATEVRIFAYVKNLALLLCFLGFGMGCALARQRVRWLSAARALLGLALIVRLPWQSEQVMEHLSPSLGAAQDVQIWAAGTTRHWTAFLLAAALIAILLLLITYVFIPLGQTVGRQIELAPRPLYGYSWNLAGSLAGILAFFAVSWLALPPPVWFVPVLGSMALLESTRPQRILLAAGAVPVALLLHDASTPHHFNLWTPYQQIEVQDMTFPGGEIAATEIRVNHIGYQRIVNLSPDFLDRHPGLLQESADENPYNLPFRFSSARPRVLIVGAGTGNDVAAALRYQSRAVDAVEIDPAILALGRRHPERPYDDPRVLPYLTDARAFMKRARGQYDLILFGLLDSHTQLSDYSNMRIDNFVYTEESLREARALLASDGILFLKFQVDQPWLGRRLAEMLTRTFGKAPTVFVGPSSYGAGATCFAISVSGQVDARLAADTRLRQFVDAHRPDFLDLPAGALTTDDWPYLYHQGRWIPGIFFLLSLLVVLLAGAFYLQIPEARSRIPSLFFFSMGTGFLLLETQVISRLALYFGTTWQVNGIVIAAILAALLVANLVIEKQTNPWPRSWTLAGILLGIALAYLIPFSRIPGSATFVGSLAAVAFAVPVFFAGLLFASEFRTAASPAAALGANMLGAVVGGLLENLSLMVGMKVLLLVAAASYALAGFGFRGLPRPPRAANL
ncbi:MAG: spermidine synthase [Terriglobales bacterium]